MKKLLFSLLLLTSTLFAFEELTMDNFYQKIAKGNFIVDFYAIWCPPCKIISKNLEQIAPNNPKVTIYKVNIEEQLELKARYKIEKLPTLIYFKDGKEIFTQYGLKSVRQLQKNIDEKF